MDDPVAETNIRAMPVSMDQLSALLSTRGFAGDSANGPIYSHTITQPTISAGLGEPDVSLGSGFPHANLQLQSRTLHEPLPELTMEEVDLLFLHSLSTDENRFGSLPLTVCKTEISALRAKVSNIGFHINDMEVAVDVSCERLDKHQEVLNEHTYQFQEIIFQINDLENRTQRNNVRIQGLPETVEHKDLPVTHQQMFNNLLNRGPVTVIEIDRAHRISGVRRLEPGKISDVICRIFFFAVK